MRSLAKLVVAGLAVTAGCAAGQPAGTGMGGSDYGSGGAVGSGGTGGTATGGGSGAGGTKGTGGGSASPNTTGAHVTASSFTLNCKTPVAADPVAGTFTVEYDNATASPVDFMFASATLNFGPTGNPHQLAWMFAMSPAPPSALPERASTTIMHTKVAGSGSGPSGVSPCDYCADVMYLNVEFNASGDSLISTQLGGSSQVVPVICTF